MTENQYGKFHNNQSAKYFEKAISLITKIDEHKMSGDLILFDGVQLVGEFVIRTGEKPIIGVKDGNCTNIWMGCTFSGTSGLTVIDKEDMDIFKDVTIVPMKNVIKIYKG